MLSTTCKLLIEKGLVFQPTYVGGKFSVHLPMSLIALDMMDASGDQLTKFYANSVNKFQLREKKNNHREIKFVDDALGQREFFEDYLKFFKRRLSQTTAEDVIKETIPILIKGVSASAFHPIIRLSYALDSECKTEIAMALASWASEYLELESSFEQTEKTLEEIIIQVTPIGINHTFSPGNISDRMKEINEVLKIKKLLIQPKAISLNEMRVFCINAFIKQNNFTLLHTVTVCFALRRLLNYVTNSDEAIRHLWASIVIAYLSTGLGYEPSLVKVKDAKRDWSQIIRDVTNSQDDHVIKLVYTSWKEYEFYKSTLYNHVAERAIKYGT